MKMQLLLFRECVLQTWRNAIFDWKAAMPAVASAYQRISSRVDLGVKSGQPGLMPRATIGPDALDGSLERSPTPEGIAIDRISREKASKGRTDLRQEDAIRQAIERGENEGMAVPSEKMIALRRDYGAAP